MSIISLYQLEYQKKKKRANFDHGVSSITSTRHDEGLKEYIAYNLFIVGQQRRNLFCFKMSILQTVETLLFMNNQIRKFRMS